VILEQFVQVSPSRTNEVNSKAWSPRKISRERGPREPEPRLPVRRRAEPRQGPAPSGGSTSAGRRYPRSSRGCSEPRGQRPTRSGLSEVDRVSVRRTCTRSRGSPTCRACGDRRGSLRPGGRAPRRVVARGRSGRGPGPRPQGHDDPDATRARPRRRRARATRIGKWTGSADARDPAAGGDRVGRARTSVLLAPEGVRRDGPGHPRILDGRRRAGGGHSRVDVPGIVPAVAAARRLARRRPRSREEGEPSTKAPTVETSFQRRRAGSPAVVLDPPRRHAGSAPR